MTSSALIERNRRNAKHSTGPRTVEGKNRSRFNAVKHACTAKLVLLPSEQPAEFNEQTRAFFENFMPQNRYEVILAEDAVYCSWQIKRCREAQWSRMREKAEMGDADERQRLVNELTELAAQLFRAPSGRPTALPGGELTGLEAGETRKGNPDAAAEERPVVVIRKLESNPLGVDWLLTEWNGLSAPLERGEGWNASERFRAFRMLGIHPMDAYFHADLASLLQACQMLDLTAGSLVSEVWNTVVSANDLPALEKEYQRWIAAGPAMDRDSAREYLLGVLRKEIERLEEKAGEHQERGEIRAMLAPQLAKVDLSHEGLLMTRYEFAWRRLMYRNTNELDKRREARTKSGRGQSNRYMLPSEGWMLGDDHVHRFDPRNNEHDHKIDVCAGPNDCDDAAAYVGAEAHGRADESYGEEAVRRGVVAGLRNEAKDASRGIERTTDDERGLVRNEPTGVSGAATESTDAAGGSLRNEPTVISEGAEIVRSEVDMEESDRNQGGPMRSVRFDKGLTWAMRGAGNLLTPGIRLRDAVRVGNRGGANGPGESRRERRLRKKEEARALGR